MPANEFEFRSGRTRPALIVAIGSLALFAVGLAWPGWIIGAPLIVLSGITCLVERRKERRWRAVRLDDGDHLSLLAASSGDVLTGRLQPGFVSAFYVSLKVVSPDRRRALVGLFHDELDTADYRRLLARLRLGGT